MLKRLEDAERAGDRVLGVIQLVNVDVKGAKVGIGGYDARVFVASTLGERRQMAMLEPLFGAMKSGNCGIKNRTWTNCGPRISDCATGPTRPAARPPSWVFCKIFP